ncbi:MAG: glycine zipper 2TM domain-containing protein [Nitrospinae bacterium]|nr:glycine zipper 2TM domain-containing protein [Nitrospinota bacterium]
MKSKALILAGIIAISSFACATERQERSAITGAALGAGAGAIIGHQFGEGGRDTGALIGGALGGATGLMYGQEEDARLQQQSGAPGPRGYQGRPVPPGPGPRGPQGGGDDFRNPYRMPSPQYCRGQWVWDPGAGYWQCR